MGNGNSPAYPLPIAGCTDGGVYNTMEKDCTTGGLTKREMFAMAAMQAILTGIHSDYDAYIYQLKEWKVAYNNEIKVRTAVVLDAIKYADALLKQLEKE